MENKANVIDDEDAAICTNIAVENIAFSAVIYL